MKKIALFILVGAMLLACQKNVAEIDYSQNRKQISIDSSLLKYHDMLVFLQKNVAVRAWADSSIFWYLIDSIHLDDLKTRSYEGLAYGNADFRIPQLFQVTEIGQWTYVRYFSLGKRGLDCPFFWQTDIVVDLTIESSNGQNFYWPNCPVRIMEQDSNVKISWQPLIPKRIVLYALAKTNNTKR